MRILIMGAGKMGSFFTDVLSFPSENVPAPPSPNWTFESGTRIPVFQKFSTSLFRLSTLLPLSITIGLNPLSDKI